MLPVMVNGEEIESVGTGAGAAQMSLSDVGGRFDVGIIGAGVAHISLVILI